MNLARYTTPRTFPPRNVAAVARVRPGGTVVASFVGQTDFPHPHVFADSGARHDWSALANHHIVIALKPGIDARAAMQALFHMETPDGYATVLDVERKQAACLVWAAPLQLWPVREDSELWRKHFA